MKEVNDRIPFCGVVRITRGKKNAKISYLPEYRTVMPGINDGYVCGIRTTA
jgi:hypothetical protein